MANFIFAVEDNFVSYNCVGSSEDASFPDDNVEDYDYPTKEHHTSSTAENYLVCDTGSATTDIAAFLIYNVNYASVTIQGHATNSWGAPSYTSGALTVYQNPWTKRYGGLFVASGFTNLRYFRVVIPTQTPTDGLGYFRTGVVVPVSSLLTLSMNPKDDYSFKAPKAAKRIDKDGGGGETIPLGLHRRYECEFSFDTINSYISDIQTLNAVDPGDKIIFYENGLNGGTTAMSFLMELVGEVEVSHAMHERYTTSAMKFVEVI